MWPAPSTSLLKAVKTTDIASLTVQGWGQAEDGQGNVRSDNKAPSSMMAFSPQQPLPSHSALPKPGKDSLPELATLEGFGGLRA